MVRYSTKTNYTTVGAMPSWLRLLPLLFVIMGVVILLFGIRQMRQASASQSWPAVSGVITVSALGKHMGNERHDSPTYSADIRYDYMVDDASYVNGAVQFGQVNSSDPSGARAVLKRYAVGQAVEVYYNPANPAQAVLEPGLQGSTWFLPIFGTIFVAVGLLFSYLMWKWRSA